MGVYSLSKGNVSQDVPRAAVAENHRALELVQVRGDVRRLTGFNKVVEHPGQEQKHQEACGTN